MHEICTKCKTCQFIKKNKKLYGEFFSREVETIPWGTLYVNIFGKYQFTPKVGGKKFQILTKGDEKI